MSLKAKRSPAEGDFLFEIDPEPLEECVTALGGLPLFVRAVRSLDVPGSVKRNLHLKQRERGLDEAAYVESFLVLNALGGDCLEDFDWLREAPDVEQMLGYQAPSAEGARKFLYRFHEDATIEQAQRELAIDQVSYIPEESAPLRGLAQVNQDVVRELGRRCGGSEDRHGGPGLDHHRELEEGGEANLRRLDRLPADVGAVGGDERGGGR